MSLNYKTSELRFQCRNNKNLGFSPGHGEDWSTYYTLSHWVDVSSDVAVFPSVFPEGCWDWWLHPDHMHCLGLQPELVFEGNLEVSSQKWLLTLNTGQKVNAHTWIIHVWVITFSSFRYNILWCYLKVINKCYFEMSHFCCNV